MTRSVTKLVVRVGIALGVLVLVLVVLARRAPESNLDGSYALASPALVQSAVGDSSAQAGRDLLRLFSRAFEATAARVNPSVVPIFSEATVTVQSPFGNPGDPLRQFFGDQFFQQFFGQPPSEQRQTVHALGSGVIVTPDGYILTNNHVVAGAQTLTVVLANGDKKSADVVGTDPQTDLALVKIDADGLPAATLGDSDSVEVGEWVIAVGNPFQLLHTTTAGIISAQGRSSVGLADYEDFIQTDAAINPGNSGGALADLDGNVIGINSAISSPSGGSVGLGFAIPINMAKDVMDQLRDHGKVVRGYLGVVLQSLTPELAQALGTGTTRGVLVGDVESGSPAERAGLQRGDVITEFRGQPVDSVPQLRTEVAASAPGTRVDFTVLRDGRQQDVSVTLGEQPEKTAAQAPESGGAPAPSAPSRLGLSVQTLTPDIASQLGYQGAQGAVIADVQPGSAAEDAGLQRGDLIEEVDRQTIRTSQDLVDALRSVGSGQSAALLVRRGDNTFYVALTAP